MSTHEQLTQKYSTWGDKLLQHTDVLYSIQKHHKFVPITVQIALTEACDSDCPFCSVVARPIKKYISFADLEGMLINFAILGAKSVELTGGGNPLLYRDKVFNKNINDVIVLAKRLGFDIGIITNSHDLSKYLKPEIYSDIDWIRISLIHLDEGIDPAAYNFAGFPETKIGLSYIIYDNSPNPLAHTSRMYSGTSHETLTKIKELVELHPDIKFVRIAGNCLIKGNNQKVKDEWKDVINFIDAHNKIFIKDIGENETPFGHGCYMGLIRPYIAPSLISDEYQVYICTSHVLQARTYDLKYSLGSINDVRAIWNKANELFVKTGTPYNIDVNSCKSCYYKFNNQLLHTVVSEMPDKNFP